MVFQSLQPVLSGAATLTQSTGLQTGSGAPRIVPSNILVAPGSISSPLSLSPFSLTPSLVTAAAAPALMPAPALAALPSALPAEAMGSLRAVTAELTETPTASENLLRNLYERRAIHSDGGGVLAMDGGAPSGSLAPSTARAVGVMAALLPAAVAAAPIQAELTSAAGLIAVAAAAGVAAAYWLVGRSRAVAPRDAALTNGLLAAAKELRRAAGPAGQGAAAALEDALITGDYPRAAGLLAALEPEAPQAAAKVRGLLPAKAAPGSSELKKALSEVQAAVSADPFRVQERLSRLVAGVLQENIPKPLQAKQVWLAKKASALARQRAAERAGAATQAEQKYNDCWLRALYALPALEAVRGKMTYDGFLARVEKEFPERDIRGQGLSFELFWVLMERLGLKAETRVLSEGQLAALLTAKGSVLGGIGFFDRDTSQLSSLDALRYWNQHALVLKAVSGKPGSRLFTVDDSALAYETRYTQAELDILQLLVYTVEADPSSKASF